MGDKLLVLISWLIGLGVVAVIAGAVVVGVLAATGDFGKSNECGSPEVRGVSRDSSVAAEWDTKWREFDGKLDGNQAASVQFTESQVTSRAAQFLDDKGAPVSDVIICFHNGDAEARGKVELPVLGDIPGVGGILKTNVKMRGTMDMSGNHPKIVITELEAGNLPGTLTDQVQDQVEDIVNSRLDDLNLSHRFDAPKFTEGSVEVNGQP